MKEWRVDFICCGRDDGHEWYESWAEADAARNAYTTGPAVYQSGTPIHQGHERAAIVSRVQVVPPKREIE